MYNILFVCYGNICRSPMAEMIFKDIIYKNNKRYMFSCVSRATSVEELGNDIYPSAKKKLIDKGITCESHKGDPSFLPCRGLRRREAGPQLLHRIREADACGQRDSDPRLRKIPLQRP